MEKIAAKYAAALFEIALDQHLEVLLLEETKQIEHLLNEQPDFLKLINQTQVPNQEKKTLLLEIFKGFNPYLLNLLQLLIDKRRGLWMNEVMKEYRHLYNVHFKIIEAVAMTVVPLSQSEIEALEDILSDKESAKVTLSNRLDLSLISGIKIRFEDKVIDASMKHKIQALREHLIEERS